MANVHDVAAYILQKRGPMSAMKLQKLVYYSQAWSLVWEDRPLFDDKIQAWANGPVVRALYDEHKGMFKVESWPRGNAESLTSTDVATIETVLDFYADDTAQQLSDLTHGEDPWRLARKGIPDGTISEREITQESMMEYYSSLQ